ncbi:aminotransferase class I/II-fold pyridoxal phosphate-dependent enzyme [Actinomadura sp. 9N215]|uniref:aminotransferase class I/II-fold pyridoxal phosphate-dependent enzyme n=1 Tax=Actinomadura sp. 9N215 TaxID=3375150 RepID=UPI0037BB2206
MHQFANIKKALDASWPYWDACEEAGLTDLVLSASRSDRARVEGFDHPITNMSSYSYLGLDQDPRIVRAAADALLREGTLNTTISRVRMRSALLEEAEHGLGELFGATAITTTSGAAAGWSVIPLAASGALTGGTEPLMVFDKNAHFCLNAMKALAADEAPVVTIRHNDVEELERLCASNARVAYVADGVYSTGGGAPVAELHRLQEKYGLLVVYDEAHGISTVGARGVGWVLDQLGGLTQNTIIIASLNKGFGASGGFVLFHPSLAAGRVEDLLLRNSGPIMWSQRINTAGLGGIVKSTEIHLSGEVDELQAELNRKVALFDSLIETGQRGDAFPIRTVMLGDEAEAVRVASGLLAEGFYAAALFFPIVRRGVACLRVMIRANIPDAEIVRFGKELDRLRL